MKVIFFSYIDSVCLLSHLFSFRKYDEVYYFDISKEAKTLLKYFRLNKHIKCFDFHLAELRDKNGENFIRRIYVTDLINICNKIKDEVLEVNPFINVFSNLFNHEKIMLFFRKVIMMELRNIIVFINVINWYRQNHLEDDSIGIEFSIGRTLFFDSLKKFAMQEYNIRLFPNFSLRQKIKNLGSVLRNLAILFATFFSSIINSFNIFNKSDAKKNASVPKIGIAYRYYGITFDLVRRCDFPWLLMSDIPLRQALIYFDIKNSATQDLINILKTKSEINYMAANRESAAFKNIPIYRPTSKAAKEILRILKRIFPYMLREILALRFSLLFYIDKMSSFINQYSKSYDFYHTHNIKIYIDPRSSNPYLIAEQIALREAGGISINYQLSSWPWSNVSFGSCADVVFLFGPYYYPLFIRSGSDNDAVVFCGFLTDYSSETVKQNSNKIRNKLMNNGAKFIMSYFDENTSDDRMSIVTNKQGEYIYEKLLNWVISDGKIGLICNPKKPESLASRISGIAQLIERAKATGRCLFMEGKARTDNWPTEAAQASDIAIGCLLGGTTVLESLLSGVRSVYLDLEGLYFLPEYQCGRNKIVFDDLDNLISAINKYRYDKKDFDEFGSISLIQDLISRRDIFRDGKAARRMGQYIKWLLDSFNEGKSREEAMNLANQKYSSLWTEKSLIVVGDELGDVKSEPVSIS